MPTPIRKTMRPINEMLRIFAAQAGEAIDILAQYGDKASIIGKVTDKPGVEII